MNPGRTMLGALLAALMAVTACGGAGTGGPAPAAARPDVTIGSTNFYEQITLAELYAQILEGNGYKVTRKFNLGNREIVQPALESGQIDLNAEYLATLLVFVDKAAHDAYQDDPTHQKFIAEMKPNWAKVRVFDSYV